MSVHTFGVVTVTVDDSLDIPKEAGNLTTEEVRRLSTPPRGLGKACKEAAACMEKTQGELDHPTELSPELLRDLGRQTEEIDQIVTDLQVLTHRFRQANRLMDDRAYRSLRRLYGLVKAQASFDPGLRQAFEPVYNYFNALGAKRGGKGREVEPSDASLEEG